MTVTITIHPIPTTKQLEALLAVLNNEYKNKHIDVITQYSTTTIRITL